MALYKYHIIKESDLSLELLESSNQAISVKYGLVNTHEDLKDKGQSKHSELFSSTFGYNKKKDGILYWVLPYKANPILDVIRLDEEDNIISQSLTLEEFKGFGWDLEEEI